MTNILCFSFKKSIHQKTSKWLTSLWINYTYVYQTPDKDSTLPVFKDVMADQWDDHFDVIPLNNGPTKGMIVDSWRRWLAPLENDYWLLRLKKIGSRGMTADSLGVDFVDFFGPLFLKSEYLVNYESR